MTALAPAAIAAPQAPPAGGPPLLVSAAEAARLLGVGRSLFYSLLSAGQIGPRAVRLGRRTLFARSEIEAWTAAGLPPRHVWQGRG
ncbi:MAG: helix-turn-helix domain-containing protein [Planctomycetota bacterium]|nr:helix-turn-helix domain-containing protein [Planctomycetota bacterium]